MPDPVKIFMAFSHKDKIYKEELKTHFATLLKNKKATIWEDAQISAGAFWDKEIERNLREAELILLLFSADALGSENFEKEVNLALELHGLGKTIVIPVLLRTCDWRGFADFSRFEVLPEKALEVDDWPSKDKAYYSIVKGVERVIAEINLEKAEAKNKVAAEIDLKNKADRDAKAREVENARQKAVRQAEIVAQKTLESQKFQADLSKEISRIKKKS